MDRSQREDNHSPVEAHRQHWGKSGFLRVDEYFGLSAVVELQPQTEAEADEKHEEEHRSWQRVQQFVVEAKGEQSLQLSEAEESDRFNVPLQKGEDERRVEGVGPKDDRQRPSLEEAEAKVEEEENDQHQRDRVRQSVVNVLKKRFVLLAFILNVVIYVLLFDFDMVKYYL